MSALTRGIFIVAAKRTAFGKYGGAFKGYTPTQVQVIASKAAMDSIGMRGDRIDTVVVGNIYEACAPDGVYLSRHVGLHCGVPIDRPAFNVNRLCASGFQSVVSGAHEILVGSAKVALTGGVEILSAGPFVMRGMRFGFNLGTKFVLSDLLTETLIDTYCQAPMGLTAENIAMEYNISREDCDKYALRSQQNWHRAQEEGAFVSEITPVKINVKGKEVFVAADEHPRPQTTLDALARLAPHFKKGGIVTAGNASGVTDGASAVIIASEEAVKEYNLMPLARLVAYSYVGVQPDIMGIGPVPAIQNILKLTGKSLQDIDLIEINEAFASQTLACVKALDLDISKLNVNGGAIAMGHPLGCSGSRITGHLAHEMLRRKVKYSIGSACIGGGQGMALMLESC